MLLKVSIDPNAGRDGLADGSRKTRGKARFCKVFLEECENAWVTDLQQTGSQKFKKHCYGPISDRVP